MSRKGWRTDYENRGPQRLRLSSSHIAHQWLLARGSKIVRICRKGERDWCTRHYQGKSDVRSLHMRILSHGHVTFSQSAIWVYLFRFISKIFKAIFRFWFFCQQWFIQYITTAMDRSKSVYFQETSLSKSICQVVQQIYWTFIQVLIL